MDKKGAAVDDDKTVDETKATKKTGDGNHEYRLADVLKSTNNFPEPGVVFQDIGPLLIDPAETSRCVDALFDRIHHLNFDLVASLDGRGLVVGTWLSLKCNVGQVMLRKQGKMPGECHTSKKYDVEYRKDSCIEVQKGVIKENQRVLLVDDILATGGTMEAACYLMEQCKAKVVGILVLAEIDVPGKPRARQRFPGVDVFSLGRYDIHNCFYPWTAAEEKKKQAETPEPDAVSNSLILYQTNPDRAVVVLHTPSMKRFADNLVQEFPEFFETMPVSWKHFPDGHPNITFPPTDALQNRDVLFVADMEHLSGFLEQLSLVFVIPRQFVRSFHVLIPYYASATMERVDTPGVIATADTVANIISGACLPSQQGCVPIHIYDMHTETIRFYFKNPVVVKPLSALPMALDQIRQTVGREVPLVLCFPDAGAHKHYSSIIPDDLPVVVCAKVRDGNNRYVTIKEGAEFIQPGSLVLIIDDLVQTGGTLAKCCQALKQAGANRVSAYVNHAVFPNRCYRDFLPGNVNQGLEHFFVSDSVPGTTSRLKNLPPFRVLPLARDFGEKFIKLVRPKPLVRVLVASTNVHKLKAAELAFREAFPTRHEVVVYGCTVPSGVSPQPVGPEEIKKGAQNRLVECVKSPVAERMDFLVSMENGVFQKDPVTVSDRFRSAVMDQGFCMVCRMSDRETLSGWTPVATALSEYTPNSAFMTEHLLKEVQSKRGLTVGRWMMRLDENGKPLESVGKDNNGAGHEENKESDSTDPYVGVVQASEGALELFASDWHRLSGEHRSRVLLLKEALAGVLFNMSGVLG